MVAGVFEHLGEAGSDGGHVRRVRRRSRQAVRVEERADLGGRPAEVARELHFLVADASDLLQRAFDARPHLIADGIQLNADPGQLLR